MERSKFTIRTSDRRVFRRCPRKWKFQSSLQGNWKRKGTETNINFWFGSAIHFAMEDFFGYNTYGDPRKAFWAYYNAFPTSELPAGAEFHYDLGMKMLSYFMDWYPRHNEVTGFETAWLNAEHQFVPVGTEGAVPAVEQGFYVPLNVYAITDVVTDEIVDTIWGDLAGREIDFEASYEWITAAGETIQVKYIPIMYHGTMDRIVVDKHGRYWILDYKTAKGADTNKLDTDDQISAYLWAFEKWYGIKPYGFIYLQLTKDAVQEPRRLQNGTLSVDKKQKTTYGLFKKELINDYGSVQASPDKMIQLLNHLAEIESPEGDKFIRWDFVKRTAAQIAYTEINIMGELCCMLNPDFYAYPSPTRDCIWDCPCRELCLATEQGDEAAIEFFMRDFEKRPRNEDGNIEPWRINLVNPAVTPLPELEAIMVLDEAVMNIELNNSYADETGFQFYYEEEV